VKIDQSALRERSDPSRRGGCFGPNLAQAFNLREGIAVFPTLPWMGDRKFAITRVKSSAGLGMTKIASEPALLVSVAVDMVPRGKYQVWIDGKEMECLDFPRNGVAIVCLLSSPALWTDCPLDFHHMYIPHAELAEIAYDHGITHLAPFTASHGTDLSIARIASLLAQPLMTEPGGAGLRLDYAKLILGSHLVQNYSGSKAEVRIAPVSKLAPWQKSRSMSMLRDNVSTTVRLTEIADECGLSPSHFARCFKATFGVSVHQSLIRLRVQTAQDLLAKTRQSIVEIAMHSGFSDQAALTRTFTQVVGTSPARWRKGSCTL
jgi:AraC family transcriptional regulator